MKIGSTDEAVKKLDEVRAIADKYGLDIFKEDVQRLLSEFSMTSTIESVA